MARAALWGAIVAVVGIFPLAAFCALTIGIPVPFAGLMRGVDWAIRSPRVVMFHGVFHGGFPALAVLGACCGVAIYGWKRWRVGKAEQGKTKGSLSSRWRMPLIIGILVLVVIVLTACIMFGVSLTWYGFSRAFM